MFHDWRALWYSLCVRRHLVALALYTLLALLLTWPLVLHVGTHVVGDGSDDPALTWNLWWFRHAVLDLQTSPLTTDFMFYPIGINLVFYTLTLLNDALSLPLQAVFGLVPAANVLLLSSFALSGYGVYLLVRELLASESGDWRLEIGDWEFAAFAVGLVYAFSSNKMLYASLGQFNIASSQWIPFYVLYLFKLRSTRHTMRNATLAAIFLLLQAYAEFTFASFLIVLTFFFALFHLRPLKAFTPLARSLTLIAFVFLLGFAPILVPMLQEMRVEGDILVQGSGFAEAFSADLLGFFVPSKLHPLLGWLDRWFNFSYINFVFIGWLTLALALVGAWAYRRQFAAKFWSISTLAFVLISLGPSLRVNGNEIAIPLPFTLFQLLPFFKGNRYPSRYSVMITLGVAVLVGLGILYLQRKLGEMRGAQRRALSRPFISSHFLLFPLISLLLLGEHWSVLSLSDFRVPSFYQTIRDEPGDFTVLELPLAWRNGFRVTGTLDKIFMLSQFYQTTHQKKMLSGNTSRNPELKFQYFTEAPVINSLIALETGHDLDAATLAQDKQLAPEVMRFFNVRHIVLRPEAGDRLRPYLETVLPDLKLWREENGVRVYRLTPSPAERGRAGVGIDPRSPMARLYFAEGWGELGEQRVWAQRNETRLLLPVDDARVSWSLSLRLTVPAEEQKVSVLVNGSWIGSLDVMSGTHDYVLRVNRQWVESDLNEITLHWTKLYGLAYVKDFGAGWPPLVVKSAGEEVGDFAHIWFLGDDCSLNQRGYNVVLFLPQGYHPPCWLTKTGSVSFDTFAYSQAAERMAELLESVQGPLRIAIAVRDEASLHRTARLAEALHSIGAKMNPRWRWSYAFISYPDAKGQVIREDASPIRPAIVSIGERITAPQVAGAVEWIEVRPAEGAP